MRSIVEGPFLSAEIHAPILLVSVVKVPISYQYASITVIFRIIKLSS